MAEPGYPLKGITVLDLGQIYNGSYAGFLLALGGADVIKIEPVKGEPLRQRMVLLPFAMLNSNKRAITLNLKSARGQELLKELVGKADVLLENFSPTTLERLGLGPEVLRAINPRLIYASGSGYGRSGPDRDNLAMDLTVQAASGIMSVTGEADGPPMKSGAQSCDFLAGVHLYGAIVTALYEREKTGKGRLVEVAMLDAVYTSLSSNLGIYHDKGVVPPRTGNRHGGLSIVPYNVYAVKDGHVAIICAKEEHWTSLLAAMERNDLIDDPRFKDNAARVENMDAVDGLLAAWCGSLSREEVFEITKTHRVPSAPVRDLIEVMNDPHLHQRGMLRHMEHPELGHIIVPNSPLRYDGTAPMTLTPSRSLGADNEEIYASFLGLAPGELDQLRDQGVI